MNPRRMRCISQGDGWAHAAETQEATPGGERRDDCIVICVVIPVFFLFFCCFYCSCEKSVGAYEIIIEIIGI